MSSKNHLALSG